MKIKNPKRKGNNGELAFAHWLQEQGINAYRDSASGGGSRSKSDIINSIDYTFEVKTVKKINLKRAWNQAVTASDKVHNTPSVIVHFDGMLKDQWLVVIDNHHWLELLQQLPQKIGSYAVKIPIKTMSKEKKSTGFSQCIHKSKLCAVCHLSPKKGKKKTEKKDNTMYL